MKRFASIWLPTIQIDRLRRAHPRMAVVLREQPFALVESGPRGQCITAVNQVAATGGIHAGLMLADARAILPALMTRPAEPARDAHQLQQLALWLGRYGPQRNADGSDAQWDGLWVDITGVAHLFGGEQALAEDCVTRLRRAGFRARIAIADTRSGAFALVRYGTMTKGIVISAPGAMRASLTDLPVEGLQLTSDLIILLRRLGLKRIGQLYALPRASLARRFRDAAPKVSKGRKRQRALVKPVAAAYAGWAEALVMRLDQALGDLGEPAHGLVEAPVYRVQRAYAEPLISHDGILAALNDLAGELCAVLDKRDEGARALRFAIYRADGTCAEVAVRTSRPARESRHIIELFQARLERINAGLGLDAVVLEAEHTERLQREQTGFAAGSGLPTNDPAVLIDRLSNRLGSASVFYLEDVASHVPERAQRCVSALTGRPRMLPEDQAIHIAKASRPAFLLEPAELIKVIAEVPDGPPVRFTWRRVTRRVTHAEGPERIAPEWWRLLAQAANTRAAEAEVGAQGNADAAGGGVQANPHIGLAGGGVQANMRVRDYYRVEDEHGGLYWMYRAGLYPNGPNDDAEYVTNVAPTWYLQGVF
jgi:protein ImuB